jgi:hypothetical protein
MVSHQFEEETDKGVNSGHLLGVVPVPLIVKNLLAPDEEVGKDLVLDGACFAGFRASFTDAWRLGAHEGLGVTAVKVELFCNIQAISFILEGVLRL